MRTEGTVAELRCTHCRQDLPVASFPLGRRRKDGTRWPMRYCRRCLLLAQAGVKLQGGGREAQMTARRSQARRKRSHHRVVLGPAPCTGCHELLVYMGIYTGWVEQATGRRHDHIRWSEVAA